MQEYILDDSIRMKFLGKAKLVLLEKHFGGFLQLRVAIETGCDRR